MVHRSGSSQCDEVIALLASKYPQKSALELKELLLNSVDKKSNLDGKILSGGRANVFNAIKSKNNPPKADDDIIHTAQNSSVIIDVLVNDTDLDNDVLKIVDTTDPSNGIVKIVDNKIEYTPSNNFSGEDKFVYIISDGVDTDKAEVVVIVDESKNNPPKAEDDEANTKYETKITINVLGNDIDEDNDKLTISEISEPTNGIAKSCRLQNRIYS